MISLPFGGIAENPRLIKVDEGIDLVRNNEIDLLLEGGDSLFGCFVVAGIFLIASDQAVVGDDVRVAMGIAVVGGMVCATFLSLFVIPAIYSYLSTEKVNVIGEEHKE